MRNWAARLGLLALAFNALVPVHIAFDLAEVLGPAQHHAAAPRDDDGEFALLALLTGHIHDDDGDGHRHHHHHDGAAPCAVCSTLGALAGFTLTALPVLVLPAAQALPAPLVGTEFEPPRFTASYRSRAPPVG